MVANGCELATRDQQYVRITCKLPKNFTLFDEQEFPRNHFRCSNQAELWVVCGDGQLGEIITGGATQLQGRDEFDVFVGIERRLAREDAQEICGGVCENGFKKAAADARITKQDDEAGRCT